MTAPSAAAAVSSTTDTVAVLPQHAFPQSSLEQFMREKVDGFVPPLTVEQFQGGMSNPTFMLTDGAGRRYVMRKKPPGKLLPSAHAVDREFRVISALAGTDVPVARAYALCEDESVIGQAFYIMEHVEGRVFRSYMLPDLAPPERAAIYDAMNDVLARLHKVDYAAVGLTGYGRVGGYLERQVSRWSKQYEASKTDDVPEMDKLTHWLPAHMPRHEDTTVVMSPRWASAT